MARFFAFRPAISLKGRRFFGLRGWAGKPLHPPLTDIPVGAYVVAPVLDIASYFSSSEPWAGTMKSAAGYVYLLGGIFSLATVLTGFFDWLTTEKGTHIRKEINAHAWTMIATTVFVLANLYTRYYVDTLPTTSLTVLVLSLAVALLVTVGGTIGGSLTYDYGFNVMTSKDHPAYHEDSPELRSPTYRPPKKE